MHAEDSKDRTGGLVMFSEGIRLIHTFPRECSCFFTRFRISVIIEGPYTLNVLAESVICQLCKMNTIVDVTLGL